MHKRIFFFSIIAMCLPIVSVSAQEVGAGSLIRCPDYASVYYLDAQNRRWVFPDEKTYFTWFANFDNVLTVSCVELATYELGGLVPYQAGTRLLKIQSSPTVYAVEPGGRLRAIPSEGAALYLYGENWASRVNDLSDGFFAAYTVDDPLEDQEIPIGSTLFDDNEEDPSWSKYYFYGDDGLYDITSTIDEVMNDWALSVRDLGLENIDVLMMSDEDWRDLKNLAWQEEQEEEDGWEARVQAAFAETDCEVESRVYPEGSYTGPMIDSHLHIANIPDADVGASPEELEEEAGDRPSLGVNITIPEIACVLQSEGTQSAISFFPVYPDVPDPAEHMVEVADRTMDLYPDLFIPFIMPPDDDGNPEGFPTVDATTLQEMLEYAPHLFDGYGEIGLYERDGGAPELSPDDDRLLEIYPIIEDEMMAVYFHPGDGQDDNLARVLEQYPDVAFLVHGDQIQPDIVELMDEYSNIYFTMNDLYGDEWLLRREVTPEEFLEYFEDFEPLIEKDLELYEDMIQAHPDRFMWGTDRGGEALWTYDVEVGKMLADYGRAFIGRLDPDVQENFAYKNAQRLFEP